jgi:hypothetical protein
MGKGCGVLFFGFFAAMGLLFMVMIGSSLKDDLRTHGWVPVPAILLDQGEEIESPVENSEATPAAERVPFRYTYEGRAYTRDTVTLSGSMKVNGRSSETGARLKRFDAGTSVTCYVNPENPGEAVLEKRSLAYAWFLALPGIFILVGLGGVYFVLKAKASQEKPISARHGTASSAAGVWGIRVFGLVFALIGGVATWFVGVKPLLQAQSAKSWDEVPCKIRTAYVDSHKGSKGGRTYSIKVSYSYSVDGRQYVGDRYNFSTGSSSGREWRDRAVDALTAQTDPVCYVNPAEPMESVLVREIGNEAWFGLIPLIFLVVGAALFMAAPKLAGKRGGLTGLPRPAPKPVAMARAGGGVELSAGSTPKAGCVGMGCVAVFWNGIVLGFFLQSDTPLGVRLFLLIFVAVGLGMIGGWAYFFLAMFNPKPSLIADAQAVELGKSLRLKWRFTGNTSRISRFEVFLTAKESATYRRGTNTTTDHHFFVHEQVFETRDRAVIANGEVSVSIPVGLMHSFEASNNKIVWAIKLHGDIAKWPDVDFEFPITVMPVSASGAAPQIQPEEQP